MEKEFLVEAKFVDMIPYLNHISEYAHLTDDEIYKRSTTGLGIDIAEFSSITLEHELCKSILDNILNVLKSKI